MTSTISSNKTNTKNTTLAMMINSIKNSVPMLIIYSFVLFISFPVFVILSKKNNPTDFNYIDCGVFSYFSPVIISVFTIVVACFMYKIYHDKRSVDLFASLPLKRRSLFLSRYFAGLIVIIVPLVVFMIAAWIASGDFSTTAISTTVCIMLGFILAIINGYTMLSLFAMLCGGIIDTLITYAVVNIGVIASVYLSMEIITNTLPGYTAYDFISLNKTVEILMFLFCPYGMTMIASTFPMMIPVGTLADEAINHIIISFVLWFALAVVYFVAAMFFVKIRKNEKVQNGFIFEFPKAIIQAIASVGTGLILGSIFSMEFSYSAVDGTEIFIMFLIGAALGAFGSFLVVTLIYNRGIKRFVKSIPVFVGSFVVLALFYILVATGSVGGVNTVPDVSDVKSVSVSCGNNIDIEFTGFEYNGGAIVSDGYTFRYIDYSSEDEQHIKNSVALHQAIVDNLHKELGTFFSVYYTGSFTGYSYEPSSISIKYELKNGKTITRSYSNTHYNYKDIEQYCTAVVNSDINKQNFKLATIPDARQANVSYINIKQQSRYANDQLFDPEYYKLDTVDSDLNHYDSTTYIDQMEMTESYKSVDVMNSVLLSDIYSSLREEFLAADDIVSSFKAEKPEYVTGPVVSDEDVYIISLQYNMNVSDQTYGIKLSDFRVENGIDYYCPVDPTETFVVTKDTYPETWKLIDDHMQANSCNQIFLANG